MSTQMDCMTESETGQNRLNEDANQITHSECSGDLIGPCGCLLSRRKHFMPEKAMSQSVEWDPF